METTDLEKLEPIYEQLKVAKKLLGEGKLHDALTNFAYLLQLTIHLKVAEENRKRLSEATHQFQTQLAESESFKETFGPVSFVKDNDMANLDFILSLIDVDSEEIARVVEEGKRLLEEGKVEEARKKFDEAIEKKPYSSEIRTDVAESYIKKELYAEAEKTLHGAQELDPDSMHIFNRLGIALRKQEKYKEAVDEYKKALEISPDDENLYFNVGFAYFKWGKTSDAELCLKKAMEINQEFSEGKKLLDVIMQKSQ